MSLRQFNSYEEMEKAHREDVAAFPFIWVFAFSKEDFIREMAKEIQKRKPSCTGIKTMKAIEKHVVSIGAGGFVFRSDVEAMGKMFATHKAERELFNQSEEHLVECIESEMWNHEYGYTRNPEDTLAAFGKCSTDLENDERFKKAWDKAESRVLASSIPA